MSEQELKEYFRMIGARGGAKRKAHPEASELARRAALAKWAIYRSKAQSVKKEKALK